MKTLTKDQVATLFKDFNKTCEGDDAEYDAPYRLLVQGNTVVIKSLPGIYTEETEPGKLDPAIPFQADGTSRPEELWANDEAGISRYDLGDIFDGEIDQLFAPSIKAIGGRDYYSMIKLLMKDSYTLQFKCSEAASVKQLASKYPNVFRKVSYGAGAN